MEDKLITYETLYEYLRKEKVYPELQQLDTDFFKKVTKYLEEKNNILESHSKKDSMFSKVEIEKTSRQISNIKKILKEIYEKRENKIIQLATVASRTNIDDYDVPTLLPEEKKLYNSIITTLNKYRKGILENLKTANMPKIEEPKELKTVQQIKNKKTVRILHPIPKFLGTNLEEYGPFDEEEVINIEIEIADLLIKNKRAELIE